jgi:hypothetical protein
MNRSSELFCTKDDETGEWHVWFAHPLGGMNVLNSFDNEPDARAYWQYQIDNANYNDE